MNDVKDNIVNNNFFYKRVNSNIKGKIFNNNNGVEIRVYNNNKDNVFNNIDIQIGVNCIIKENQWFIDSIYKRVNKSKDNDFDNFFNRL